MLAEGEPITLDSNTGRVFAGEAEIVVDYPSQWLDEIIKWRQASASEKTAEGV
jgi:hypothetical protein